MLPVPTRQWWSTTKCKSVVIISSELPQVLGMSDWIYVMNEGKIVGELSGEEATQELILSHILLIFNEKCSSIKKQAAFLFFQKEYISATAAGSELSFLQMPGHSI